MNLVKLVFIQTWISQYKNKILLKYLKIINFWKISRFSSKNVWELGCMSECMVYYLKELLITPHLYSNSTTDPKPEILSAVWTGNRMSHDGRNVRSIMHVRVCRKDDIFRQRRLNHSGAGGRKIAFRRVYPARAYTTLAVLVRYSQRDLNKYSFGIF